MINRLLEEVKYRVEETRFGVWRRYGYESGQYYHEFKSHACWMGMPVVYHQIYPWREVDF